MVCLNSATLNEVLSRDDNLGVRGLVSTAAVLGTMACMVAIIASDVYVSNDHMSIPANHDNVGANATYYVAVQRRRTRWRKLASAMRTMNTLNRAKLLAAAGGGAQPTGLAGLLAAAKAKPKPKDKTTATPLGAPSPTAPSLAARKGGASPQAAPMEVVEESGCIPRCRSRVAKCRRGARAPQWMKKLWRWCNPAALPGLYMPIVTVFRVMELSCRVALVAVVSSVLSLRALSFGFGVSCALHALLVWHMNLSLERLCGSRLRACRWRCRCVTGLLCLRCCCGRPQRPQEGDVPALCCPALREPDPVLRKQARRAWAWSLVAYPTRLFVLTLVTTMVYPGVHVTWPALVRACYSSESLSTTLFVLVRFVELGFVLFVVASERGVDHGSVMGLGMLAALSALGLVAYQQVASELQSERVPVVVHKAVTSRSARRAQQPTVGRTS